jgi:hypothetical protein
MVSKMDAEAALAALIAESEGPNWANENAPIMILIIKDDVSSGLTINKIQDLRKEDSQELTRIKSLVTNKYSSIPESKRVSSKHCEKDEPQRNTSIQTQ